MLQALLRQRDSELEERGKLLYKTKARLAPALFNTVMTTQAPLYAPVQAGQRGCPAAQVAIEQLQQELATTKHDVEVVKSEARQVGDFPRTVCEVQSQGCSCWSGGSRLVA